MQRESIFVSLSPAGVRVAVMSGNDIARVERVMLDPEQFEAAWKKGLHPIDEALRTAVNALGIRPGSRAAVLYHGPHSVAEVFHAPATGNAAMQAADLYLQQTLPSLPGGWLTSRVILAEVADGQPHAPAMASTSGKPASGVRTIMLTFAESANDADVLGHWLRRAGLKISGILPTKAAMLHEAMTLDPMAQSAQPRLYVHLGEHAMTIAGWIEGQLCLARCAEVGYSLLSDALFRSGRAQRLGDIYTREYATRLLFSVGLPKRGEVMDQGLNLKGDSVLPLVQPALQRYAIELRQTLRFGMLESDIARVKLWVTGPGSAIPSLCESLGDALELPSERMTNKSGKVVGGATEDLVGDLQLAVAVRAKSCWLVPPSTHLQHVAKIGDQALRMGIVAATIALMGTAAYSFVQARELTRKIDALAPQAQAVAEQIAATQSLDTNRKRADAILQTLSASLGARPDWKACLVALSNKTADGIELFEIAADYGTDGRGTPTLTLRGRAPAIERDAKDPVVTIVEALQSEPFVQSARVLSSRTDAQDNSMREFTIVAQLAGLGVRVPVADASEGAQP